MSARALALWSLVVLCVFVGIGLHVTGLEEARDTAEVRSVMPSPAETATPVLKTAERVGGGPPASRHADPRPRGAIALCGVVLDETTGAPIEGATVEVRAYPSPTMSVHFQMFAPLVWPPPLIDAARTGPDGRYRIRGQAAGEGVVVDYWAHGYRLAHKAIPARTEEEPLHLTPAPAAEGVTVDVAGNPLPGARVRVWSHGWLLETRSDEAGRYRFAVGMPEYVLFFADIDGKQGWSRSPRIVLRDDAPVEIEVLDHRDRPVPGAGVQIAVGDPTGGEVDIAGGVTDSRGVWRARAVVGPLFTALIESAGGTAGIDRNRPFGLRSAPDAIEIVPGRVNRFTFVLGAPRRLHVEVVDDLEQPVGNAEVAFDSFATERVPVDENGRASSPRAWWSETVNAYAAGHIDAEVRVSGELGLDPSAPLRIVLRRKARVNCRVVGPRGEALKGVEVRVVSLDFFERIMANPLFTDDAVPEVDADVVPPADLEVVPPNASPPSPFVPPPPPPPGDEASGYVDATPGVPPPPPPPPVAPSSGAVSSTPVGGVEIIEGDLLWSEAEAQGTTGADGTVTIEATSQAPRELRIRHPGYGWVDRKLPVLDPGAVHDVGTVRLVRKLPLLVATSLPDGSPAEAKLVVEASGPWAPQIGGPPDWLVTGETTLQVPPEATFVLRAEKDGYLPAVANVDAAVLRAGRLDLRLGRAAPVEVVVTDEAGRPVEGVLVGLRGHGSVTMTTDEDGQAVLGPVPPKVVKIATSGFFFGIVEHDVPYPRRVVRIVLAPLDSGRYEALRELTVRFRRLRAEATEAAARGEDVDDQPFEELSREIDRAKGEYGGGQGACGGACGASCGVSCGGEACG